MKSRLNPLVVGTFVLVGLLFTAGALLMFGAGRWFADPYRVAIHIHDSSVSGLDVGSAVKLSGVRIGRVESVGVRYDRESEKVLVRVVADVDEASLRGLIGEGDQTAEDLIRELLLDGLRAKLNFSGITGLLYVELEIARSAGEAPPQVEYEPLSGYPIVPMSPSLLAEFTDSISSITTGLASVDFAGISSDLRKVLGTLDRALAGLELKQTTGRIEAAADAVQTLAADPALRAALTALQEGLGHFRDVLGGWNDASPELRQNLTGTLESATRALSEVQRTAASATTLLSARQDIPHEIVDTLASLQRAADALERLADYLERNPSAIIRGRANGTSNPE